MRIPCFQRAALAAALLLYTQTALAAEPIEPRGPPTKVQESLRKGADFLWSQQAQDGGWHSTTYGLLRSGQTLTPFVLETLLQSAPHRSTDRVEEALKFILKHRSEDGALGMADKKLHDYPNYATALGVQALLRVHTDPEGVAKMQAFLRGQQFAGEGWGNEHPAFGAWGMGGITRTVREPGHLDLSMTRYVLEALRASKPESSAQSFEHAQVFLHRCHNFPGDGGFFFSTVVTEANKAGSDGARFKSYGTPTADGVLALLACGASKDAPRIKAAFKWLLDNPGIGVTPGFPKEIEKRWDTGLQFYYYAAAAKACRVLSSKEDPAAQKFRTDLTAYLLKTQRPDGSWVNENFLVKEDDPLIATTFALSALRDLSK
jgi:squalene-hopene/tetraprenyl-beta-curcumene cyclase